MKIQGSSQIVGVPVVGVDGRPLGRVVAVDCKPDDPYTPTWFVIRRGRLRSQLRAVPAEQADWSDDRTLVVVDVP